MKYYKAQTGEVYAYETEEERQKWGAPELVEMTTEEVDAHLNPPGPSEEEKLSEWRNGAFVTRRQGRLALLEAGYLEQVETEIDSIEDSTQRTSARIEYEADTWERSNAFLQAMWAGLGGTPEALDDLFVLAATK